MIKNWPSFFELSLFEQGYYWDDTEADDCWYSRKKTGLNWLVTV